MVNLPTEIKAVGSRSPGKRWPSTSPSRPVYPSGDQHVLSEQQSPVMRAVQKVVLEEDNSGEDPTHYEYSQKWYESSSEGDRVNLADSALKAIRSGSVIATDERGYSNPENRKKRNSKNKEQVLLTVQ